MTALDPRPPSSPVGAAGLGGRPRVFAGRFQEMSSLPGQTREELRAEIARDGVVVPIVVAPDGEIIDGHNRWEIACELDIEESVPVEVHDYGTDEEKRDAAVSLNVVRRSPSKEDQAKWRAVRNARIVQMRREGKTQQQIADEIGVSREAVKKVEIPPLVPGTTSGIEPDPAPSKTTARTAEILADRQDQIVALHAKGLSAPQIAEQLGLSRSTVYKRLGKHRESETVPIDVIERIREMAAAGHTRQQMAQALGITFAMVQHRCSKHSIDVPGEAARGRARSTVDGNASMDRWIENLTALVESTDIWLNPDTLDPSRADEWSHSIDLITQQLRRRIRYIKQLKSKGVGPQ